MARKTVGNAVFGLVDALLHKFLWDFPNAVLENFTYIMKQESRNAQKKTAIKEVIIDSISKMIKEAKKEISDVLDI